MNPVVSKIWLLNFFAALFLAPLLFGIIAKVKAFFAGRKGIPLFQLYFDIFKLLRFITISAFIARVCSITSFCTGRSGYV